VVRLWSLERYTDEGHPYRLILSLTSAFDEKRARLMPIGRTWSVSQLAGAMIRHAKSRGDLVHLAWVLMSGENTQPDEAREIRRAFGDVPIRVHVIDVNDPSGKYRRAGDAERGGFLSALAAERISFVRRYSGGSDIHAACGMLASVTADRAGGAGHGPRPTV
jgi:23S rRNA (adenine2503-C2)-methyltransferase